MKYFLDTNILLHYLRESPVKTLVERLYSPLAPQHIALTSVVNIAEIRSLSIQNNWGIKRSSAAERFLKEFLVADISTEEIIQAYAEIDAFSQGKLPGQPLGTTSRNMGKKDLWIAATAHVLGASLLTTDKDFSHLHGVFVDLVEVPQH